MVLCVALCVVLCVVLCVALCVALCVVQCDTNSTARDFSSGITLTHTIKAPKKSKIENIRRCGNASSDIELCSSWRDRIALHSADTAPEANKYRTQQSCTAVDSCFLSGIWPEFTVEPAADWPGLTVDPALAAA